MIIDSEFNSFIISIQQKQKTKTSGYRIQYTFIFIVFITLIKYFWFEKKRTTYFLKKKFFNLYYNAAFSTEFSNMISAFISSKALNNLNFLSCD